MEKENILKKYPWLMHLLVMVGVSFVILAVVLIFIRIYARQGKEYVMPDFVNKNIAEAMATNEIDLDFVVMDSIFRDGAEGGIILTQDPQGGTMVKSGRKVYVSITAYNADDAILPELAGLSVRQAVSELYAVGLVAGKLTFVEDPYKNSVEGDGENSVPFVIGKTADKARRDILSVSLNVGTEYFRGVKNKLTAVVYRQEPDYTGVNKYPYGTSVDLWYIDADNADISRMVTDFKVDSSKIIITEQENDGRPSPEDIDENWQW